MSNTIQWSIFDDADADSFKLYRAVTGLVVTFPNSLVTGDILSFSATSPSVQKVTVSSTDIDSVLASINSQAKGLKATRNTAGTKLFVRCTAREGAKLKLYACTFLTHTSQSVRIIAPRSEYSLVTTVSVVPSQTDYTYSDVDGDPLDWYQVTSVKTGIESVPSTDQQSFLAPPNLCMVEGRITDLQNNPVSGVEVKASVMVPVAEANNSGLTTPEIVVVTDVLGRWNMPLIRSQQVLFLIESIGYNQVVILPDSSSALFRDLKPVGDYYFSPSGDPET